jgi:hypothetical protein
MRFRSLSTGFRLIAVFILVLVLAGTMTMQAVQTHAAALSGGVAPNSANELDCNGWSTKYKSVRPIQRELCADPIAIVNGNTARFKDNGWYIGHDEPSVKFVSSAPGSGNHMTYFMQLAVDPHGTPTTNPNAHPTVTDYAELSPAPWFGLAICDGSSYPQNTCTPDSDSNTGLGAPTDAGSAFMELQLYPPGYQPFVDGPSCDSTHYCAALTIDSLECTFGFANCNNACVEPVNFAYLQRNGVPAGPPSPQLTDLDTFTPNNQTLLMNQGDSLSLTIQDTPKGLKASIFDFSTGQSGFIVASAHNGFMNTSIADCSGTPFNFHPEYSTASQQNQVPWAALEGGVLMEQEMGHFETCSSLTNPFPINESLGSQSFSDPQVYQTCNGPTEKGGTEDGCSFTTGLCTGATTQDGIACPDPSLAASAEGELCEFSDALCMPAGSRTIYNNGKPETVSWPIAGCQDNWFQNGDLDFDGTGYIPDWPDGSPTHPTPFRYYGPFDAHGSSYPSIQFETDVAGSEFLCDVGTGTDCTAPPIGAKFYPFWTLGSACQWNFGNTIAHQTLETFGGDAEYGTPDVARYAGTIISPVMANPQFSGKCSVHSNH